MSSTVWSLGYVAGGTALAAVSAFYALNTLALKAAGMLNPIGGSLTAAALVGFTLGVVAFVGGTVNLFEAVRE